MAQTDMDSGVVLFMERDHLEDLETRTEGTGKCFGATMEMVI